MSNINSTDRNSSLAFGQPLPFSFGMIDDAGRLLRRNQGPLDSLVFGKSLAFMVEIPDQEKEADRQGATDEDTLIGFAS